MTRLKLILSLVALSGLALVAVLQYENWAKLRTENEWLRGQLHDLSEAHAAQTEAAAGANDSWAREQLSELRRLRGEVTQLRGQTDQIAALKEANQKLVASLKDLKAYRTDISQKKSPEDALLQDIHPRDSWAFRGYATPEATVESYFWAEVNGDKATLLEAVSPEIRPKIEKEFEGKNLVEEGRKIKSADFRIVDRHPVSDDEIVLTIYTTRLGSDGHIFFNEFNPMVFQRIGGEWRVTDKHAPND